MLDLLSASPFGRPDEGLPAADPSRAGRDGFATGKAASERASRPVSLLRCGTAHDLHQFLRVDVPRESRLYFVGG